MRAAIVTLVVSLSLTACNDSESDPIFGASTVAEVTPERLAGWDQAARWGDHRDAGYLARAAFEATPAAAISTTQVSSWDTAAGWGDHASAGYLTAAAFAATPAAALTAARAMAWDTAASWGDHADAGYLSAADFAATPAAAITATQVSNWSDAWSWGNHATAGYQTTQAFTATPAAGITATQIADWNAAAARTEADPKVGTLTSGALPRWNGASLEDSALVQVGTNLGVGTTSPSSPLSVGTAAHLGKSVLTDTSRTCSISGFSWTHTVPSAAPCTSYCTGLGFAAGVVSVGAPKTCGGAQCNYISDFATCAVGTMGNTGACNSCTSSFVCTCLTTATVLDAELQVNHYLRLAPTTGAPPAADCNSAVERGRLKVDPATNLLWLCTASGWQSK